MRSSNYDSFEREKERNGFNLHLDLTSAIHSTRHQPTALVSNVCNGQLEFYIVVELFLACLKCFECNVYLGRACLSR